MALTPLTLCLDGSCLHRAEVRAAQVSRSAGGSRDPGNLVYVALESGPVQRTTDHYDLEGARGRCGYGRPVSQTPHVEREPLAAARAADAGSLARRLQIITPHGKLGWLTPADYAARWKENEELEECPSGAFHDDRILVLLDNEWGDTSLSENYLTYRRASLLRQPGRASL